MHIDEIARLYETGMMVTEIAGIAGMSYSTTWRRLRDAGALRGKKKSIQISVERGRFTAGRDPDLKRAPISEETRRKQSEAKAGKGRGFRVTSHGYIEYTFGEHKGRSAHIVAIEAVIGRRLMANECVHHINHDRSDNRLENLQLMTRSEHASLHAIENNENRTRNEKGQYA
jgi:hypothetical protein